MRPDGLFGYELMNLLRGRSLDSSDHVRSSCIYVVQPEVGGPFKIGYSETAKLDSRLSALQTGCPWKLNLCSLWRGDRDLERDLHTVLASIRMEGEWFEPHPTLSTFLGIKGDDSYRGVPISDALISYDDRGGEVVVHTGRFYRAWHMATSVLEDGSPTEQATYTENWAVQETFPWYDRYDEDSHP